jgi:gliding motility-associated-like protein
VFHDLELLNPAGVELRTAIEVSNNTNFILGDFRTPIDREDIHMNFIGEAYYTEATNSSKINGLASVATQAEFVFPVGDEVQTRPLILYSEKVNALAKCRYFLKNPDTTFTPWPLSSIRKSPLIAIVSNWEFWQLQGSVLSTITVRWNNRSNIAELTTELDKITLAGWNKTEARWVPLGRESLYGDLTSGEISSNPFVPDEYGAITFASLCRSPIQPALHNYFLSPNGDGVNDFLVFPELEQKGNNTLKIYDRYGLNVFEKENYTNEFEGRAKGAKFIISQKNELPEGIYYYLLWLHGPGLIYQGFLYLER